MKILIPSLFLASIAYGQSPCFPYFDFNNKYINHFEFNSLFNIQSDQNGDCTVYSVDEFTTSVTMGVTYSMQVAGELLSVAQNRFTAWIDFDNNGNFESDEIVLDSDENKYVNQMVTIPVNQTYLGLRRMRVMAAGESETLDPCGYYDDGEAEDYFITITDEYIEPCYCTPFVKWGYGTKIEDFKVDDLLNCDSGYDQFSYYTYYPDSVFSVNLELGETYRMLVSKGTTAGTTSYIRVFVDYNNNYVFSSSEIIVAANFSNGIVDQFFTIPNNSSILGEHRLRVRISGNTGISNEGCRWATGETEDYIINIIPQDTTEVIPDWQKIIHLPNSQGVYDIKETYDKGFALSLVDGPDINEFRLIKFSIDGDTLWSKFPASDELNYPLKMVETHDGGFIICGLTGETDPYGDAFTLKLDACGDLQWKETYGSANQQEWASHIIQTSDSNYTVLIRNLNDTSRIALFKLDSIGNAIWQNDYTHYYESEASELIQTSDGGYLITGHTYTPNPGDSSVFWARSMVIKVDYDGEEQWTKLLGIYDTTVSLSFSSVEIESGGFLIPTTVVDPETYEVRLGVYRIDEVGNLLNYKPISGIYKNAAFGKFIRRMDGNNYCIVSSIYCGCFDNTSMLGLYMIDKQANVLDSVFINDYYLVINGAVVTENNKLMVSGSKDFPDSWDIFMYKFNEDLEFDSLYYMNLNYDWLCDIIIFQPELSEENYDMELFPNPACDGINVRINELTEVKFLIEVINIDGSVLKREYTNSNELKYISLADLNAGIYIITISENNQLVLTRKIVKSK
jgi:hypothetical protein